MDTPAPAPARFPSFNRIFRSLFSWRTLRRCLVALAALITLIAIFYTEEARRGKRAWENYREKLVAEGLELDPKAYVPPPVPDDQNFAMTPFLAPLLELNPEPLRPDESPWRDTNGWNRARNFSMSLPGRAEADRVFPDFNRQTDFEGVLADLRKRSKSAASPAPFPSRADAAAGMLREFTPYQPVIEELRAASRRPYSRFNVNYGAEDPASILLPHLGTLRGIQTTLSYQAAAELATGKTEAAFNDVQLMFYLASSIRNEPIIISHLVRMQLLEDTTTVIREGLNAHLWSDQHLQKFQTQLEGLTLLQDLERPMNAERVAFADVTFELIRRHRPNYFSEGLGVAHGFQATLFRLLPKGWTYFEQVNYNRMRDAQSQGYDATAGIVHPRAIDVANQQVQDLLVAGSWSRIWNHRLFATIMLPHTANLVQQSTAAQTAVDEAATACALERFHLTNGKYPESLAVLTPQFMSTIPHDVINGWPLKYRLTDGGQFILYSVGWNETDDGGKIVMSADGKSIDSRQGDWVWPPYSAK